jgi:hypothetical protein
MSPKSIIIVTVVAIVAAIAYPQVRNARQGSKVNSAEYLKGVLDSYRLRVPFKPKPNMVVFRVEHTGGVLNFGVRIENVHEGNLPEAQRATIRREVTRMLCEEREAAALNRNGMTVRASIADRTGTPITTVVALPNSC